MPSNEFRGYVLRKIMRRAMRHGMKLGITETFLPPLVDVIAREMGDAYPELRSNRDTVVSVVRNEEERFSAVLAGGLPRLEDAIERAAAAPGRRLPGEEAFKLYDTFGLPLDFIEDLAGERQVVVDREAFERAMEGQREKARAKSAFEGKKGQEFVFASDQSQQGLSAAGDRFEGYTTTTVKGTPVIALFDKERRQVRELNEGSEGYAALGQTPFYVEAGGQVSDVGSLHADASGASAHVDGMSRIAAGLPRLHRIHLTSGTLHERDIITAEVDAATRDATRRNHTATHLLHAALRKVLGSHVKQAGSLVAPDRLRFDFVHSSPVTREQTVEIERIVNEQIYRNAPGGYRRALDAGSHGLGRDGALRREVRRPRARRLDSGLQHGALRRHALPGDRRHRVFRDRVGRWRCGRCAAHRGGHRFGRRPPASGDARGA